MSRPQLLVAMTVAAIIVAVVSAIALSRRGPDVVPSAESGLRAVIDQARLERVAGTVHVRLTTTADRPVRALQAEISSNRFDPVRWRGDEAFDTETDLTVALPTGRCGAALRTTVRLTYRDASGEHMTTLRAPDRYGAVGFLLDRDCAAGTMREAARLDVGAPRVEGQGETSVLVLPVSWTPTGRRDDVRFGGFESTPLLDVLPPLRDQRPRPPLVGDTQAYSLRLSTSRCDPHALAEDKVGTLIGVRVVARDLPSDADFHLPLPRATRAAMHAYYAEHCGF